MLLKELVIYFYNKKSAVEMNEQLWFSSKAVGTPWRVLRMVIGCPLIIIWEKISHFTGRCV